MDTENGHKDVWNEKVMLMKAKLSNQDRIVRNRNIAGTAIVEQSATKEKVIKFRW